ncbi:MAG: dihydroorotate dehydrogenase-like protein, partial [Armatimonadota bacterium]
LEDAGCDALEINIYAVQADPEKTSSAVEEEALDVVGAVKSSVSVPVVVKLSPFYTSIANFAKRLADAGADGLVLFNRFYQPTINTDTESLEAGLTYSVPSEQRLPLRWIAILSAQLETDIAASTGVYSGFDAVRYILAGAKVVQVVSSLLQRGIGHVAKINHEISKWMDSKGYNKLQDFRGKLNQRGIKDPFAFERAQYIRALRSFGG